MATMKTEDSRDHEDRTTIEEEKVEKELDAGEISRLCAEHGGGVSPNDGIGNRKATADFEDHEDGSGGKNEKYSEKKQEADHYQSSIKKTY